MLILTEKTPNPAALKFLPGARLTDGRSWTFTRSGPPPVSSPLAEEILDIEGVEQVFIAEDFVTVSCGIRGPDWGRVRPEVILVLANHLGSGAPAVEAGPSPASGEPDDLLEREIRQVLALYVRPTVASHGGQVLFDRFEPDTGVLWIRMTGACGGCPSSRMTLKGGVEQILRRYVPEVTRVEEAPGAPAQESVTERVKRCATAVGHGGSRPVFTHMGKLMKRRP